MRKSYKEGYSKGQMDVSGELLTLLHSHHVHSVEELTQKIVEIQNRNGAHFLFRETLMYAGLWYAVVLGVPSALLVYAVSASNLFILVLWLVYPIIALIILMGDFLNSLLDG